MPVFHSRGAFAERVGVNDVCPPGVEDVCNVADTNPVQGELPRPEGDPEVGRLGVYVL